MATILNTVFKISADNSKYKQGLKEAEVARTRLGNTATKQDAIEARAQVNLEKRLRERIKAQKDLEAAISKGIEGKALNSLLEKYSRLATAAEKAAKKVKDVSRANASVREKSTNNTDTGLFGGLSFKMAGIGAAIGTASLAFDKFNEKIKSLQQLKEKADDLNLTADALYNIQVSASQAGIESSKVDDALKKLAITTNGDVKTALIDLAKKAENGTLSIAEAQKYFGDNAIYMMRFLKEGADEMSRLVEASGGLEDAAFAASQFQGIWNGVSAGISKDINMLVGSLAEASVALYNTFKNGTSTKEEYAKLDKQKKYEAELRQEKGTPILQRMDNLTNERDNIRKNNQPDRSLFETQLAEAQKQKSDLLNSLSSSNSKELAKIDPEGAKAARKEIASQVKALDESIKAYQEAIASFDRSEVGINEKIQRNQAEYVDYLAKTQSIKDAADKKTADYLNSQLSTEEKLNLATQKLISLKNELNGLDKRSHDWANKYSEASQVKLERQKLQTQLTKEQDAEQQKLNEQKAAELKTAKNLQEQEEKKRKTQEDAWIDLKKQQVYQLALANAKSEKDKQAIRDTKAVVDLMGKYGISQKEAYQYVMNQNKINNKGKDKDDKSTANNKGITKSWQDPKMMARAKRVLARGKKGTVGQKDLDEAQAYLNGEIPEEDFKSVLFKDNKTRKFGLSGNKFISTSKKKSKNKSLEDDEVGNMMADAKQQEQQTSYMLINKLLPQMLNALNNVANATKQTASNTDNL